MSRVLKAFWVQEDTEVFVAESIDDVREYFSKVVGIDDPEDYGEIQDFSAGIYHGKDEDTGVPVSVKSILAELQFSLDNGHQVDLPTQIWTSYI